MSIGSFLATAGTITEGIEKFQTESELRRLARVQAEAQRSQIARAEQERMLLQQQGAKLAGLLPPESMVLGTNANIGGTAEILPAITPAAPIVTQDAAGLTPPATPTPPAAAAPAAAAAAAAPKTTYRKRKAMEMEGKIIQPWDNKRPDRLNDGVAGFTRVDPNASNFQKMRITNQNEAKLDRALGDMAYSASGGFGSSTGAGIVRGIAGFFQPQDVKKQSEADVEAVKWYQSSFAKDYFRRNPELIEVAKRSPTNFYRGLLEANRLRDEQKAAPKPKAAPAAAPAAAAPTSATGVRSSAPSGAQAATTRGARKFDTQGAQYDALIQQAAALHGVDATILKRLIASESGFNPNATNPTSGALGMAQIMPTHIQKGLITDAQARDPATAINFAAAHLAQNLRNRKGDYRNALLDYKGAVSQKGVKSMTPVVTDIVSGLLYNPQEVLASIGPQLAKSRDPATNAALALSQRGIASGGPTGVQQAGLAANVAPKEERLNLNNLNTYLARSDKLPQSVTYVNAQRQFAYAKAQAAMQTGNIEGYEAAVTQLKEYEADLTRLMGAQAIIDIQNFNNPNRASQLISFLSNGQIELQMRQDGRFAYFGRNAQGQRVVLPGRENVSRAEVLDTLQRASDEVYRKSRVAAETAAAEAAAKFAQDVELEVVKGRIEGEIEQFKGGIDLTKAAMQVRGALEAAKLKGKNFAEFGKDDTGASLVAIDNPNNPNDPFIFNPSGFKTPGPNGTEIITTDAIPLSQLAGTRQ